MLQLEGALVATAHSGKETLALLERSKGVLDKATYRRQRAVLLTARALAMGVAALHIPA